MKSRGRFLASALGAGLLIAGAATGAIAAGPRELKLAQLKPVPAILSCESLAKTDLTAVADTPSTISAARLIESAAGQFCQVRGTVKPKIEFEVDLPVHGWQQRFLQTGCGGLCGMLHVEVSHAATCAPALQGGLVVASDDMGHQNRTGPGDAAFGADPQLRIDFAYRGNHATALVAKALIKAFYGQPPRYSYFSGCSDGGREALIEAERYPKDFDGIAAGAAVMNFQVQNSFYHAWQFRSNTDADGRHILLTGKLPVLHRAALAACDALDALKDGLISDPRACHFDPAVAACPADARDTSSCLTAAEVDVARKLYAGPSDAEGHRFIIGGPQPGSELSWAGVFVPDSRDAHLMSEMSASGSSQYVIFPEVSAEEGDVAHFAFTQAHFARLSTLHPLYDATDTDLTSFQKGGGKLILWHGWSDPHISPINSIAYYSAVQKQLGARNTETFLRLFLFPGMYHCGGGDGFGQFDVLTPLMIWVESGSAPEQIIAAQVADVPMLMGPPPGAGTNGPGGGPGAGAQAASMAPIPRADAKALRTRPVYPYPLTARYSGQGSQDDAASYTAVPAAMPQSADYAWAGSGFYAPDFLLQYAVKSGKLVVTGTR